MKSAIAISYELDDIELAAAELTAQIRQKLPLLKESIGILSAQPDMETCKLSKRLHELLGFSIVGGTTAAAAHLSHEGQLEFAVVLHVMTADDCLFSCSISDPLIHPSKETVTATYHNALAKLREKQADAQPKAIIFITCIDYDFVVEAQLECLHKESGGAPIFGYVSADDFEFSKQRVFLDGVCTNNLVAILIISGNVKPIFEVKNLAGTQNLSRKRVTRAEENIIYEIDNKPAWEYIKSFEFITSPQALWGYQFFVELQDAPDNDGVSVSRALQSSNTETGEVFCAGRVPQNSFISLKHCEESDVESSCREALLEFAEKIRNAQDDSYTYSTVFVASCSLRSMYLSRHKDAEGKLLSEMLLPGLAASGIYAFGEFAPTSMRDGKATNRFHNATFTLCAF